MVIIGANLAICFTKLYKLKNLASKINENCTAIGEYCAPKLVFGPGKLSGVSRNGPPFLPPILPQTRFNPTVTIETTMAWYCYF